MKMLRRALTCRHYGAGNVKNKLPRDMEGSYDNIPCYTGCGNLTDLIALFTVVVKRGSNGKRRGCSPHRIFIKIGDRLIPAGRLAQAKLDN